MATRKRPQPVRAPNARTRILYVESSALLAAFLESDGSARRAIRAGGRIVTSALTLTEAHRAVVRARATGRMSPEQESRALHGLRTFARRSDLLAITDQVLERAARPFPVEPVRTLDAIHLSSVELLGEPQLLMVVTRDVRVAQNARALGYSVV